MDDMNDLMTKYLSHSDSPLLAFKNQHQPESLFSPDFDDESGTDSYNRTSDSNNDVMINGHLFCHKKNFNECLNYLNQELTSVGLHSLYERGSQAFDPVKLINCTYHLLERFQHSKRLQEELETRIHRLECDLNQSKQHEQSLLRQLDQSQQETAQAREQERQVTVKNKILSAKLKSEKEEVRRLQSVLQHRDIQHKHELKKNEHENHKLKERLHKLLTDKKMAKTGVTLTTVLQRPDKTRGTWSGSKQEEELFRSVISGYEAKNKELLVENSGLRKWISDIQAELLADNTSSSDETSLTNVSLDDLSQEKGHADTTKSDNVSPMPAALCHLPLDFLEGSLLKSISERCRQLKKCMKNLEKQKSEGVKMVEKALSPASGDYKNTEDIDKLMKDIKRYKDIIEQQEQFIQDAMAKKDTDSQLSFLNESEIEEEKENLEMQKKLFEEQKATFCKERNAFTEAAIRLHRERKKFEDAKALFLKDQFLQITPFNKKPYQDIKVGCSPSVSSEPPLSESPKHEESLSPVSAICETPENQKLGHTTTTPNTVDLYQLLGFNNEKKLKENRPKSADPNISATPSGFLSKRNCSPSWASSGTRRCTSAINHTRTPQQRAQDAAASQPSNIKMLLFQNRNKLLDLSDREDIDQ